MSHQAINRQAENALLVRTNLNTQLSVLGYNEVRYKDNRLYPLAQFTTRGHMEAVTNIPCHCYDATCYC